MVGIAYRIPKGPVQPQYAVDRAVIWEIMAQVAREAETSPKDIPISILAQKSLKDHPGLTKVLEENGILYINQDENYWRRIYANPYNDAQAMAIWKDGRGLVQVIWFDRICRQASDMDQALDLSHWTRKETPTALIRSPRFAGE